MKIWWKALVTCVSSRGRSCRLSRPSSFGDSEDDSDARESLTRVDRRIDSNSRRMVREGRQIFRFDTFGDEAFWGDLLGLHKAIEGTKFGGVATPDLKIDGVSPGRPSRSGSKLTWRRSRVISSTP